MNKHSRTSNRSDAQIESDGSGPDPLWLPRGTVRAIIAMGMIAVWAALETGVVGIPASDAVRSIAVGVAAGYGILRSREQRAGGTE